MTDANPFLDAALRYAARGWRVFPLQPKSKNHMATDDGCLAATTEPDILRRWWANMPQANVAIATGPESGLYVLDVDTGPGKNGQASLDALVQLYGALPETPLQQTGGGGWQHLFAYPEAGTWGNTASAIGEHLDTRGRGGYIVAPPSIHPNGNAYRWAEFDELMPVAMPPWLCDLLSRAPERAPDIAGTDPIPSGQRNDTLARIAGRMRRWGASVGVLFAALSVVNQERCRPPLNNREVAKIAESIAAYQADQMEVDTLNPEIMAHGEKVAAMLMASPSGLPQLVLRTHEDRLRERLQPPPMLIEDVMALGGVGVIAAMPGVGKTLISIHLASCVAGDALFLGKKTAVGRVLYACPDSPASTERRMLAMADKAAAGVLTVCEMPPMPGSMGMIGETVKAMGDCKLVVIDTYDSARDHAGGGYADQDALVEQILGALRRLAAELCIGVVLVHHATRSDAGRTRGSLVFDARADWIAMAEADGDRITLKSTKVRDGERGTLGSFRVVEVDVAGGVPALVECSSKAEGGSGVDGLDLQILLGLSKRDPNAPPLSRRELATLIGVKDGSLPRATERMRATGLMEIGHHLLTPAGHFLAMKYRADQGLS